MAAASCWARRYRVSSTECSRAALRSAAPSSRRWNTVWRPEHRFPAGVEDSFAALAALVGQAAALGVAAEAVSVGGVSPGGNFAAAVALMARDRGGPALILQLLEIAGTDLTKSSYAWRNFAPGHDTTRERDLAMVDLYLPDAASRAHPYASPLFAPDLSGLPPAYVMNAEFDPRRDECEAYVARLRDAGVAAVAAHDEPAMCTAQCRCRTGRRRRPGRPRRRAFSPGPTRARWPEGRWRCRFLPAGRGGDRAVRQRQRIIAHLGRLEREGDAGQQVGGRDRLGPKVIEPKGDQAFTLAAHRVGGESDDRHVSRPCLTAAESASPPRRRP